MKAPVEAVDAEERIAIDAAKQMNAAPVPGSHVTEQIAERLRDKR
jgi:hypothetical protein